MADFLAEISSSGLNIELFWRTFVPIFWQLTVALAALAIGLWLSRRIQRRILLYLVALPHVDETAAQFISRAVYAALLVVVAVVVLTQLGVNTSSLIAVLGGAALAIGLALQGTLGNLAAGLQLMLLRPLSVGSVVQAGGTTGTVDTISLLTTLVRTFNGERVVVPNSALVGGNVLNYTQLDVRRLVADVGIAYGEDARRTRDILMDLARNHELVLQDPEPDVWVTALGDSSVTLSLRVWTKREDYVPVLREILLLIKERLDKENVEIPFPQRVIEIKGREFERGVIYAPFSSSGGTGAR